MSKLAQLRERRNALAFEANALNTKHPADQRMPEDDSKRLDGLLDQITAVDGDIKREQRALELLAEKQDPMERAREKATKTPGAHGEQAEAIRNYLIGGIQQLTTEQREELRSRVNPDIRAAMSTSTNSEGGFTMATEWQRSTEQAMKAIGGALQAVTIMNTATGATMNFPTNDATSETGEIVGQNTTVARLDTTFGNVAIDVYKYSSKDIAIPFELLQDSFVDIEALIQEILSMRLGRILNTHITTGSGSSQPRGLVTGAAAGKVGASGQTTSIIYDDLVDLEHSIDPAYRVLPNFGFMFNDNTLAKLRKLKDGQGRPIFVPGYETGAPGGAPDRILGRPFWINQDMANMAANAKSVLCGAFSKYRVRRVMDLTLFRMTDSAFTRNGQVGFLAMNRMGGNLVDVSGSTVKHYANAAS
jgi:HK97 family phage major capsid protein